VAAVLAELPPDQQAVVQLSFVEGLSHSEIAARVGVPLGTVKSWIRRGLERLKLCLDRAGVAP